MAKIMPFKALFFNRKAIKDFSLVVCPPYDVISAKEKKQLYKRHPKNIVRLILSKPANRKDRYKVAGDNFLNWIDKKILIQDRQPYIYFYRHRYKYNGKIKNRIGFISLLKFENKRGSIFPHEHTHLAPKQDRLQLLRNVKANLSPIFALFIDKNKTINAIYNKSIKKQRPFIKAYDKDKSQHCIWRIKDSSLIKKIKRGLQNKSVFIADGHHRFEVGLMYRNELKCAKGMYGHPSNYIMTYFTNASSDSLVIFPVHRVIRGLRREKLIKLKHYLGEYFYIKKVRSKERLLFLMKQQKLNHVFGMYLKNSFFLLTLKRLKDSGKIIKNKKFKEYENLDVSVLNRLVIKGILGIELLDVKHLVYTRNLEKAISLVDNNRANLVFILNPIRIKQLVKVASKGIRLPPKSTYFYPKLLSGLLINKM